MTSEHEQTSQAARDTVIIVGGKGGLESRYRELADDFGYDLKHYEQRFPAKTPPSLKRIAMVIVMVTMVSHPLMARARSLVADGADIVYLKSASVSAVKGTLEAHKARELRASELTVHAVHRSRGK
jgi:hypothetical protein